MGQRPKITTKQRARELVDSISELIKTYVRAERNPDYLADVPSIEDEMADKIVALLEES